SKAGRAIASVLIDRARSGGESPRGMLIEEIDGLPPSAHPLSTFLVEAGFVGGARGSQAPLGARPARPIAHPPFRGAPSGGRPSKSLVSSPFSSRYYEPEPS